jgi:hypothetical protein
MKNQIPEISRPSIPFAILPEGVRPPLGTGFVLEAWMDAQAGAICRGEWSGWPCAGGFDVMSDALIAANADQGVLWLVDDLKRELRPCFSIGGHSEFFLREIRQPLILIRFQDEMYYAFFSGCHENPPSIRLSSIKPKKSPTIPSAPAPSAYASLFCFPRGSEPRWNKSHPSLA